MRNLYLLSLFTLVFAILFCSIAAASLQNGLIVYYTFDEADGKAASDNSKNKNDATLVGNASWAPNEGKFGGALKLDGAGASAEDTDGGEYINGLDAFTVSVWVKSNSVGHDRGIFHGIDPGGGDIVFTLRYDASSWEVAGGTNLVKGAITTTGGVQAYEGSSNVQTTEWQHLAFAWRSGEQLALYIDGKLDKDPIFNGNATDGEISGASKFVIGKGAKDGGANSWPGLIDDVRFYNRVLAEKEIAQLASGALAVEPSGKLATTWADLKQNTVN